MRLVRYLFSSYFLIFSVGCGFSFSSSGETLTELQGKLLRSGDEMLEKLDVSYVYGGSELGNTETCEACNICLESKSPPPRERLNLCAACRDCSLDCSHFTQLVYSSAGLPYPYLTTSQMLSLSQEELAKKYGLVSVSTSARRAMVGDLLVYNGHVVILEKILNSAGGSVVGDIIHATGGRDLKGPGLGIQRERSARLDFFRGELLRVLRHKKMDTARSDYKVGSREKGQPDLRRLRKIERKAER